MLPFDLDLVRKNVEEATTTDLLERATVFREGMELEALELIETELRRRGISFKEQAEFDAAQEHAVLRDAAGLPLSCFKCSQLAVEIHWVWHWAGIIPIFRARRSFCATHRPLKQKSLSVPSTNQ
jgi:hypothetical protein